MDATMNLDLAKAIYRTAIDPRAHDAEGAEWWAAVAGEVAAVVKAPSTAEAAPHIAWWHNDWRAVGDTPTAAAQRIRAAARRIARPARTTSSPARIG